MDDPLSFSLTQVFPPTQVIFLILFPVALYIAAFVSRSRLVTIQKLPRYGSSISQPSAPVSTHPDKDACELLEKEDGALLKSEEPQEDNGTRIVKIERQSSWLHTAFRWALCAGLIAADAAFVYAAVETVWDVCLCLFLSVFVACLVGVVALGVVGGYCETLARKPDGSVVSGIIATGTKGALHPMYFAAIHLGGFAIVPSLVLSPLAYPFIPLAMITLGACAVGLKFQLKHMILLPYIMSVAALMLGSVIAAIIYFTTSSNDGESSGGQKENVPPSFWSLDTSTRFRTTAYQEVLPIQSMAAPLVQLVACLYRYDRTPTLDELDAMKIPLLHTAANLLEEEVGPKALILPMVWIVRQRLIALKGIKPTLNYSNLAVLITMLWVALLPVVIEALFPQLPIASLIASLRTISLFCALLTIPAAVLFVAWFRGEARKVWAYEEDWGVKMEPEREA